MGERMSAAPPEKEPPGVGVAVKVGLAVPLLGAAGDAEGTVVGSGSSEGVAEVVEVDVVAADEPVTMAEEVAEVYVVLVAEPLADPLSVTVLEMVFDWLSIPPGPVQLRPIGQQPGVEPLAGA